MGIKQGVAVVFSEEAPFKPEWIAPGEVYRVQKMEIVPKRTILPQVCIDAGYIPDQYMRFLKYGIRTNNHDLMGSDRFVTISGRVYSSVLFRPATAEEVNRHAHSQL